MSYTRYAGLSSINIEEEKHLLGKTRTVCNKTFFFFFFHINRANALECVILLKKIIAF